MGFEEEIRASLGGKPPAPLLWFYVALVTKGPEGNWSSPGGGEFMGAVVIEATSSIKAVDALFDSELLPKGAKTGTILEIPADKLPPPEFRNTLLSRAQVETLWPGVRS